MAAVASRLVVLVDHLRHLSSVISRAPVEFESPSLLRFLSRADCLQQGLTSANALRCELFGLDAGPNVPVAALTQVAESRNADSAKGYWLRVDPVTLRADRMRVFLLDEGLDGLTADERKEVLDCIAAVFSEEGLKTSPGAGHLRLHLDQPLDFQFTPLEAALGMDLADALPDHSDALRWRRLINEMQIALHNSAINERRRQAGQKQINGGWIWGGGTLPDLTTNPSFTHVYSGHPVTQGLAVLANLPLEEDHKIEQHDWRSNAGQILLDWTANSSDAQHEWSRMESLFKLLLEQMGSNNMSIELLDGKGSAWRLTRMKLKRFWRSDLSLETALQPGTTQ